MITSKIDKIDLSKNLKKLSEIADWFDEQEEVDVEEGLKKVKEAAILIKESKSRLAEVENEFEEIKREVQDEIEEEKEEKTADLNDVSF
jgi:hypothetical protein